MEGIEATPAPEPGSDAKVDRLAGAAALSDRAIAIGIEHGVVISECVWDIGDDFGHEYAHRLDIITAAKTVRLYFPDVELTTSGNKSRQKRIEDRLQRAVAQLLLRVPPPTYANQ